MSERTGPRWLTPPTKSITAPDGSIIHYSNLPGVGEPRRHDAAAPEAHTQPHPQEAAKATPSTASSESLRERLTNSARAAFERVGGLADSAFQVLIKDDVDKLVGAHSTPLQRVEGAAGLASWAIPEGKIAEIAGHAVAKAAEIIAAHGAEHIAAVGAGHATQVMGIVAPWNRSDIAVRPLTAAERRGEFKSADDLKAFLGRAGSGKDWHHIVESNTEERFGAGRVHNTDNVGAIERDPTHQAISKRYQQNDPFLPIGPNGREQSLRTYLKDKPWEQHVDVGEDQLRYHGIDPQQLRAETRERFEQRLAEHDRRLASRDHAAPSVHPGAVTAAGRAEPAAPRQDGPLHVMRDGQERAFGRGYQQPGTILDVDGDTIVQNIGRGRTATYSRDELLSRANPADRPAFDAVLQPGNNVEVRLGQSGLSMQQNVPGLGWTPVNANASGPPRALEFGIGGR